MGKRFYEVRQGWIRYRQVGSNVEERPNDSPSCDVFESYGDAKVAYDAIDLQSDWRTERMCAGSSWKYDYRDAYKSLESCVLLNGYADGVEVLEFEKYGEES
jgi:hypothetical protein